MFLILRLFSFFVYDSPNFEAEIEIDNNLSKGLILNLNSCSHDTRIPFNFHGTVGIICINVTNSFSFNIKWLYSKTDHRKKLQPLIIVLYLQ